MTKPGRQPLPLSQFRHQVSAPQRARSVWFEEYGCYVTPEFLTWGYTDNPGNQGVSWRDAEGEPIAVAVAGAFLDEHQRRELGARERPKHPPIDPKKKETP
jgi:hypothetical protein